MNRNKHGWRDEIEEGRTVRRLLVVISFLSCLFAGSCFSPLGAQDAPSVTSTVERWLASPGPLSPEQRRALLDKLRREGKLEPVRLTLPPVSWLQNLLATFRLPLGILHLQPIVIAPSVSPVTDLPTGVKGEAKRDGVGQNVKSQGAIAVVIPDMQIQPGELSVRVETVPVPSSALVGTSAPTPREGTGAVAPLSIPLLRIPIAPATVDAKPLSVGSAAVPPIAIDGLRAFPKGISPVAVKIPLPGSQTGMAAINVNPALGFLQAKSYASQNDARAIPLLDEYLAAIKDGGDAFEVSNTMLEIARLYRSLGEEKRASATYALVPEQGYAWATGVAFYDEASALIARSRHEEARKLLQTPVEGQYADQIQIALLSLLGYSYYRTGEFAEAERFSRRASAQVEKIATLLKNEGLEDHLTMARQVPEFIARWQKQPFYAEPETLVVKLPAKADGVTPSGPPAQAASAATLWTRVDVRSYQAISLEATVEPEPGEAKPPVGLSSLIVRPAAGERVADNGLYYQNTVLVGIPAAAQHAGLRARLIFRSPQHPKTEVVVPLRIEDSGGRQ